MATRLALASAASSAMMSRELELDAARRLGGSSAPAPGTAVGSARVPAMDPSPPAPPTAGPWRGSGRPALPGPALGPQRLPLGPAADPGGGPCRAGRGPTGPLRPPDGAGRRQAPLGPPPRRWPGRGARGGLRRSPQMPPRTSSPAWLVGFQSVVETMQTSGTRKCSGRCFCSLSSGAAFPMFVNLCRFHDSEKHKQWPATFIVSSRSLQISVQNLKVLDSCLLAGRRAAHHQGHARSPKSQACPVFPMVLCDDRRSQRSLIYRVSPMALGLPPVSA